MPGLVDVLTGLGYEEPTPIQQEAIPALLRGHDLLGQAATGTGKTAAFALPLLQRLAGVAAVPQRPAMLVLVPTRELAMQVADAAHKYGKGLGTSVIPVYGGQAFDQQIRALRRGVHLVVATPGRALDHIRRGTLDLSGLVSVVLDEADEMLDMGFADELEAILDAAPKVRQTALFSATLPPRIAAIAERHLTDPVRIRIAGDSSSAGTLPRVRQAAYLVNRSQKVEALVRVLDLETPTLALIFCRTRTDVDTLTETLGGRGYRAEALHGGMSQEARDRVMKRTRAGTVDLLVATDVAARGLDIDILSHVINYSLPDSPATYVHRIGRTGRAGREGVAVTLVEAREHRFLRNIEGMTRQRIQVQQVPTVHDVQARRLGLTGAAIREALEGGGNDRYRVVVEALAGEHDPMEIAMAAIRLAHEQMHGTADPDEDTVLEVSTPASERNEATRRKREGGGRKQSSGMARIYIGAGKKQKLRPTDIVGAIVNEAGVPAQVIGGIEITERFSLVELPEEEVDKVVKALRATTIKGKKLTVRRDLAGRR